ncbi:hypothetical protein BS78_08G160800 [Paspalum vaginatum]|nr:hypothetical protein BS78_08G160800 [Paspalum vaginatum]KAJ1266554.1 hypothetical protein BS78_08G160800 [Paspalum vaginatum]
MWLVCKRLVLPLETMQKFLVIPQQLRSKKILLERGHTHRLTRQLRRNFSRMEMMGAMLIKAVQKTLLSPVQAMFSCRETGSAGLFYSAFERNQRTLRLLITSVVSPSSDC